jgi:hypothetical protein
MMKKAVILQCCGQKLNRRAPACELYQSTLFKKSLAWARQQVNDNDIYILSAKHGLLKCAQVIMPYNVVFRGGKRDDEAIIVNPKEWAQRVLPHLQRLRRRRHLIFVCGIRYVENFPFTIEYPWGAEKGMWFGKRLLWLMENTPA